jgi:CBS domain-containing protein
MKIQDIMSHPVITAPINSTAEQIARLMWEFDCGIIPLVNDDGRLAGVITDRDICMAAYTQGKPLGQIAVTSAMSKQVMACHAGDAIETAERLMRDRKIRRVPVLDQEDRVAGVVSMNDIARLAARAKKSGVDRELVETLAAVCQPRAAIHAGVPSTDNIVAA